jgi:hypothetical protein
VEVKEEERDQQLEGDFSMSFFHPNGFPVERETIVQEEGGHHRHHVSSELPA